MITLKDYVNWGLTHCDKTASAEGVPLVLEKCVKNKKMKQLEVYGQSVQNGTPSPEAPVEVESVGEKCTKNLYDAESYPMTKGYYIHGSEGGFFGNASYVATEDFIPCIELRGKTITINHTGGSNPGIAYYDENKEFISGTRNASSNNVKITSVVPENASFYRFCVKAEYANVAQVEFGSTATEYEPYGKYKIPVTVKGSNILNCSTAKSLYGGNVLSLMRTDTSISLLSNQGSVMHSHIDLGLASEYVGKTLTASFDIELTNGETLGNTRFVVCDADGQNRTEVSKPGTTVNGHYCVTATLGSDYGEKHLTLRLYVDNPVVRHTYDFKNIMVSKSDTDVPFEPYVELQTTNVYLNEPLRSADVLDFKAKKVIRIDSVEDVECELPILSAKTSVIEINTSILPSNIKGKYIKR